MLQHGARRLEPLSEHDEAELKDLIAEHSDRTGSPVAQRMLGDWDASVRRFVKVMPRDYKRALAERVAREAEAAANGSGSARQTTAEPAEA